MPRFIHYRFKLTFQHPSIVSLAHVHSLGIGLISLKVGVLIAHRASVIPVATSAHDFALGCPGLCVECQARVTEVVNVHMVQANAGFQLVELAVE